MEPKVNPVFESQASVVSCTPSIDGPNNYFNATARRSFFGRRVISVDRVTLPANAPAALSCHQLNYSVKERQKTNRQCTPASLLPCCTSSQSKQIINNVSSTFVNGMNAIMGPSGCGKSSLLDILADRKDPRGLKGLVLVDGAPRHPSFRYTVGYVVQDDICSGTLTVRENLSFSAHLRLPKDISAEEKNDRVSHVIAELGLEHCADTRVGTEAARGVSGGEKKRTCIGMELVLSPKILFLDEPTTGNIVTPFSPCVANENHCRTGCFDGE